MHAVISVNRGAFVLFSTRNEGHSSPPQWHGFAFTKPWGLMQAEGPMQRTKARKQTSKDISLGGKIVFALRS